MGPRGDPGVKGEKGAVGLPGEPGTMDKLDMDTMKGEKGDQGEKGNLEGGFNNGDRMTCLTSGLAFYSSYQTNPCFCNTALFSVGMAPHYFLMCVL